jgi:hypothetical protein
MVFEKKTWSPFFVFVNVRPFDEGAFQHFLFRSPSTDRILVSII